VSWPRNSVTIQSDGDSYEFKNRCRNARMAREEREPGAVRRRNSDDVCSYSWNTGAEFSFQVMAFRRYDGTCKSNFFLRKRRPQLPHHQIAFEFASR
jgi:hypothetical protein